MRGCAEPRPPIPIHHVISPSASHCLRCGLARSQIFPTRQPDDKVRVLGAAAYLVVSGGTGYSSLISFLFHSNSEERTGTPGPVHRQGN